MTKYLFTLLMTMSAVTATIAQKVYKPRIETCSCRFKMDSNVVKLLPDNFQADFAKPFEKIDSSFKTQCGYLIVPENRKKTNTHYIKLPFIVVKSKNQDKKSDPILFTNGGPGTSSIGWAIGAAKSDMIRDRDCIVLEQRGTRYAQPYLRNFELDAAIRESYRKNLNKDSMVIEGVKRYKIQLESRHIDLSGYNTDETVADIHDLLKVLKIDSVNLMGGSYSGGLMMAVLQQDPVRVRSLILDSPLPTFVPIDEEEPNNFHQALNVYFDHVSKDSTDAYKGLKQKFESYFTGITGKVFLLPYLEKGAVKPVNIQYTKNELLSVILDRLFDDGQRKDLARMISDIIKGNHAGYVTKKMDEMFRRFFAPDGMRMSVYCADQTAYHSEAALQQLYKLYPYLEGYHINDVYKTMCDCWKVPPVNPITKSHFYSNKPALLGDGEMDAACNPIYIDMIHQRMPNSQHFLFINRSHGVGGKDWYGLVRKFLDNPYQKLVSDNKQIIGY